MSQFKWLTSSPKLNTDLAFLDCFCGVWGERYEALISRDPEHGQAGFNAPRIARSYVDYDRQLVALRSEWREHNDEDDDFYPFVQSLGELTTELRADAKRQAELTKEQSTRHERCSNSRRSAAPSAAAGAPMAPSWYRANEKQPTPSAPLPSPKTKFHSSLW